METQPKQPALKGKKVVILGGSAGLGLATAEAAAAEGATVVIASSNQQRIDQALQRLPDDAAAYTIDLKDERSIKAFFEKNGRFDHLVYTAGENLNLTAVADTNLVQARDFFTIRFWGAIAAVKYGAPFIAKGGSIGLMSGVASQRPGPGWSLGAAICGAMEGFSRAMAVELAPVRVNAVLPGVIRTNLWDGVDEAARAQFFQAASDSSLVKRSGEAADIGQTFVFLMKQGSQRGRHSSSTAGQCLDKMNPGTALQYIDTLFNSGRKWHAYLSPAQQTA